MFNTIKSTAAILIATTTIASADVNPVEILVHDYTAKIEKLNTLANKIADKYVDEVELTADLRTQLDAANDINVLTNDQLAIMASNEDQIDALEEEVRELEIWIDDLSAEADAYADTLDAVKAELNDTFGIANQNYDRIAEDIVRAGNNYKAQREQFLETYDELQDLRRDLRNNYTHNDEAWAIEDELVAATATISQQEQVIAIQEAQLQEANETIAQAAEIAASLTNAISGLTEIDVDSTIARLEALLAD